MKKSNKSKPQSNHPKVTFKVSDPDRNIWLLENVRVSFPNLWRPGKWEGAEKPMLDTSFLVPADQKDVVKAISVEMLKLAKSMNGKIKKLAEIKHLKFVRPRDVKANLKVMTMC